MSTRCTTHFTYQNETKPEAIIYRHSNGYPSGAGVDLLRFLDEVNKLSDKRFNDPSYLAAKYVVFLADMFNTSNESRLDFLSVGVVAQDPGDIEYRYVVNCSNGGRPVVKCYKVSCSYPENVWSQKEVDIQTEAQ